MSKIFKERLWYHQPFIRITIAFITGIIIGKYFSIPTTIAQWIIAFSGILLIGFNFIAPRIKFRFKWIAGIFIHLMIITFGWLLINLNQQLPKSLNHLPIRVIIQEPLISTNKSMKSIGSIYGQKIILYFQKDDQLNELTIGSQVILYKYPDTILNANNPGGFNFKQYAASQKIYHQTYLKKDDYKITNTREISITKNYLNQFSVWVLKTINQFIPGNKEASVAEALLIGYKKNLDKELLQAYSNTGVVHIIAISGLHLGMIYGLLLFILKPIKKSRQSKWLQPFIILIVIWVFTLVTGAAPSILRSAIMFSFIILAEQQGRSSPIYNGLAASAFCILFYNPLLLWDVGFQLSYAAVISIVAFSKPITNSIYFENKLLRSAWQLTAITLSAQICTLPLLLFYFHQFPNLFIFTNFIAIPLSGLILYLEILLLVFAPLTSIATVIGKITSLLIKLMNELIQNTAKIPFAVTENIQINFWQTLFLYIFIISIAIWMMKKKSSLFLIALFSLTVFIGIRSFVFLKTKHQQKIIVYFAPKLSAIDLINGNNYQYIGNPSIYNDPLVLKKYLTPTRILYRATEPKMIINKSGIIYGSNKKLLIINNNLNFPTNPDQKNIDFIIITGNPNISLKQINQLIRCNQYVFDCSNPMWKIERWKKEAENLHLRYHSVPEKGAFEINL